MNDILIPAKEGHSIRVLSLEPLQYEYVPVATEKGEEFTGKIIESIVFETALSDKDLAEVRRLLETIATLKEENEALRKKGE